MPVASPRLNQTVDFIKTLVPFSAYMHFASSIRVRCLCTVFSSFLQHEQGFFGEQMMVLQGSYHLSPLLLN